MESLLNFLAAKSLSILKEFISLGIHISGKWLQILIPLSEAVFIVLCIIVMLCHLVLIDVKVRGNEPRLNSPSFGRRGKRRRSRTLYISVRNVTVERITACRIRAIDEGIELSEGYLVEH